MSRRPRSLVMAALVGSLVASTAQASPLFELSGGIGGTGGLNPRAAGASAASTYFNPALLPDATQEFDVGLLVMSDQIGLTLDGRPGGIVPVSVGDRRFFDPGGSPISNATVPTDWLEHGCHTEACKPPFVARPRQAQGSSGNTHTYTALGLVSRLIKDRLVLGLYALVPNKDFTTARSFYNDEREQFFSNSLHPELYADRMTATSLAFGAGSRVLKQLSVGLSFTLSLKNIAGASTYVRDSIDYDKVLMANDVHVKTAVSPHLGLAYTPLDGLQLTATVHSKQSMEIDTAIRAALPSGQESGTTRVEVHDFVPWTLGLGASARVFRRGQREIALVGSAQAAFWSAYVDRHGERPSDDGGRYAWKDVVSEALGVRYTDGAFRGFLDLSRQPSPVPPQTGRKSYVDNDRIGAALGADLTFPVLGVKLRPGLQLQAFRLLHWYQKKSDAEITDELPDDSVDAAGNAVPGAKGLQTNNPGWPGFASDGWILGGAVTVALVY